MSNDAFINNDLLSPAIYGVPVTPSDANDLQYTTRAIWVGGAGNLNVDMYGQINANTPVDRTAVPNTVLFSGIVAGTMIPIAVRRVRATLTTATLIIALY